MRFAPIYCAFLWTSIVHGAVLELLATNDTTYFQTRQLSGQQYGLDYNLQNNYTTAYFEKFSNRPRTLFDWNGPSSSEEKTEIGRNTNSNGPPGSEKPTTAVHGVKNSGVKGEETERVENNVWWPWKNYDDWLNGRGLKAEHPKKKEEKKTDRDRKNRKRKKKKKNKNGKNGKNEKRRKNPKTGEKRPSENVNTVEVNNDLRHTVDNTGDRDDIAKKGSIPKIRYNSSPIDIILSNLSLVPALVKYTSRNYTYDVNECLTNNGGCEGLCINTPGSYRCHCPPGFMVADTKCEDVDECLLRNGHGPCQGACSNTWGGYRCSCRGVAGTRLSGDGHTCDDVDECRDETAGCSHQCINTVGSAFCVCPDGLRLDDDWKTCVDVDECADPELQQPPDRCADLGMACLNTHGSYACA